MSFFEKEYIIKDCKGKTHSLTADQIYNLVLEDSRSDYGYFIAANELMRVCNEPDFPEEYRCRIKIILLNCFASLELDKEVSPAQSEADTTAVYSCYNSLQNKDEEAMQAKHTYLKAIILSVLKYTKSGIRLPSHTGTIYHDLCRDWADEKFNEFVSNEQIDFNHLRDFLYSDFDNTIKEAEEAGLFEVDDAITRKQFNEYLKKFHPDNLPNN